MPISENPRPRDADDDLLRLLRGAAKTARCLQDGTRVNNLVWRSWGVLQRSIDLDGPVSCLEWPPTLDEIHRDNLVSLSASLQAGSDVLLHSQPSHHPLIAHQGQRTTLAAQIKLDPDSDQTSSLCIWQRTLQAPDLRIQEQAKAHLAALAYQVLQQLEFDPPSVMQVDGKNPNASPDPPSTVSRARFGHKKGRNPSASAAPVMGTGVNRVTTSTTVEGNSPACSNCATKHTPLWRRGSRDELLCNACGLYFKLHNKPRPLNKRAKRDASASPAPTETVRCHNCKVEKTPMWRKGSEGNVYCNACHLYAKLHGVPRPNDLPKRNFKRKKPTEEEPETEPEEPTVASPSSEEFSPLSPVAPARPRPPAYYTTPQSDHSHVSRIWPASGSQEPGHSFWPSVPYPLPNPLHHTSVAPSMPSLPMHMHTNQLYKRPRFGAFPDLQQAPPIQGPSRQVHSQQPHSPNQQQPNQQRQMDQLRQQHERQPHPMPPPQMHQPQPQQAQDAAATALFNLSSTSQQQQQRGFDAQSPSHDQQPPQPPQQPYQPPSHYPLPHWGPYQSLPLSSER